MRIIILGPPGSGKGTYASRLTRRLNIPHISTGDLVREEIKYGTSLGERVRKYSEAGELVPDVLIIDMLRRRLDEEDCERGYILDGFPRTVPQAEALEGLDTIDVVVNLKVPDDVIVKRLSFRLVCKRCGAIYNELFMKPNKHGVCDKCGGELYRRKDDEPEVIRERLKVYQNQTKPLIEYYLKKGLLNNVSNEKIDVPPDEVVEKILRIVNKR